LKITYIKHADIDKEKWDRCIDQSANGLIYAHSFYLDSMSENWDALVQMDYEAVMPLTWKKKFGIFYLHQPAFTQQLGIFGNNSWNENVIESFLNMAFKCFPFVEINLNFGNIYKKATKQKCNLILPLNHSFEEIQKKFRKDFVKKTIKSDLMYLPSNDFEDAILLFQKSNSKKISLSKNNYERFTQLCYLMSENGDLIVRKVTTREGELLSTAILFKDLKRIYYILSTTSEQGRKQQANYFLLYHVIKEFSERDLIFDFEGSEIQSIKAFFKKFGAVEQIYPFVRMNNLPFLQKQIKNLADNL
jgi:hypothetical protein